MAQRNSASFLVAVFVANPSERAAIQEAVSGINPQIQLQTADCGYAGLMSLARGRTKAAIVDEDLPLIGGLQLAQIFGHDPQTAGMPVMVLRRNAGASSQKGVPAHARFMNVAEGIDLPELARFVRVSLFDGDVLILDDDERTAARYAQKVKLLSPAAKIRVEKDGLDALQAIAASPPAAIIMCQDLPGLPGARVLHALRSTPEFADIPVFSHAGESPKERDRAILRNSAQSLALEEFLASSALVKPLAYLTERGFRQAAWLDEIKRSLQIRRDTGLAERLGLSPSTVSSIRSGRIALSEAAILRIHQETLIPASDLRAKVGR